MAISPRDIKNNAAVNPAPLCSSLQLVTQQWSSLLCLNNVFHATASCFVIKVMPHEKTLQRRHKYWSEMLLCVLAYHHRLKLFVLLQVKRCGHAILDYLIVFKSTTT